MYSRESTHTTRTQIDLLSATEPFIRQLRGPSEQPQNIIVGEFVTMLPAGSYFPVPLSVHIKLGCNKPDLREHGGEPSVSELLSRVREVIRSSFELKNAGAGSLLNNTPIVQFGRVEVDLERMELYRSGARVALTAHEFKTLRYFLSRPHAVISREELLNRVWGYHHYPTTRTVDNRILKLRQKLELNPSRPTHFLTVHGVGYKFVP